jgi:hypothetical protein
LPVQHLDEVVARGIWVRRYGGHGRRLASAADRAASASGQSVRLAT